MRGRPPRPIGVPGDVDLTELRPGVWLAIVRVRDASGKRRKVKRVSPPRNDSRGRPVPDRDGARARDAVLAAASDLSVSVLDAELSTETTIRALYYEHYRPYLVDQGRAPATLDRYDFEAKGFDSAFGHRRLIEAPTPVMEKFLTTVADTRGAGAAKSSRTVLSGMYNYAIRMSNGAITVNPLREVKLARRKGAKRGGARQLTVDEVRDGKFAFVVDKIDIGKSVVGRDDNQFMQKKAQGEWAVLSMTVTNISDKPQTFFAENQKLIAGGKTFSADSTASMYLVDDALMTEINPGNKIDVKVAFDVPVGTEPDQVKLHDSAFSGGVTINLKRTS